MLPLLYVVRMDVEADYRPEFVTCYDPRHDRDLIGTGFHSCDDTQFRQEVLCRISNHANTVYEQIEVADFHACCRDGEAPALFGRRAVAAHPGALDRLEYGVSGLSATLLNCDNWVA